MGTQSTAPTRMSVIAASMIVGLVLAGCGSGGEPSAGASATETPSATADPTPTETAGPTEDPTPSEEPTVEVTSLPTDVPEDVMLPASAYATDGPAEHQVEVQPWIFDERCEAGAPVAATGMRLTRYGTGEYERPVPTQQVAVFASTDDAVAEADRLKAAMTACAEIVEDGYSAYLVEPLAVGAQGTGVGVDYDRVVANGGIAEEALGYYVAITRRGTAVTLVSEAGGERTVATAREVVTAEAGAAWELLCRYTVEGC